MAGELRRPVFGVGAVGLFGLVLAAGMFVLALLPWLRITPPGSDRVETNISKAPLETIVPEERDDPPIEEEKLVSDERTFETTGPVEPPSPRVVELKSGESAVLFDGALVLGLSYFSLGTEPRPTLHITIDGSTTENLPLRGFVHTKRVSTTMGDYLISVLRVGSVSEGVRLAVELT